MAGMAGKFDGLFTGTNATRIFIRIIIEAAVCYWVVDRFYDSNTDKPLVTLILFGIIYVFRVAIRIIDAAASSIMYMMNKEKLIIRTIATLRCYGFPERRIDRLGFSSIYNFEYVALNIDVPIELTTYLLTTVGRLNGLKQMSYLAFWQEEAILDAAMARYWASDAD